VYTAISMVGPDNFAVGLRKVGVLLLVSRSHSHKNISE